ncbi:hypothetical protein BC834DRAFT_874806 [Gloeopeniophorella convolvens]|nr:hypothetical protein BC834DRAFT_874806 [Gloeopeniophorella convolvens]
MSHAINKSAQRLPFFGCAHLRIVLVLPLFVNVAAAALPGGGSLQHPEPIQRLVPVRGVSAEQIASLVRRDHRHGISGEALAVVVLLSTSVAADRLSSEHPQLGRTLARRDGHAQSGEHLAAPDGVAAATV